MLYRHWNINPVNKALAGDLAANAENPAQENAQALLYYIQKVAKVA